MKIRSALATATVLLSTAVFMPAAPSPAQARAAYCDGYASDYARRASRGGIVGGIARGVVGGGITGRILGGKKNEMTVDLEKIVESDEKHR